MGIEFSERALRALGMFGLTTDDERVQCDARLRHAALHARALHDSLRPGRLALITGPSASGKSSILRHLAALVPDPEVVLSSPDASSDTRVIDALGSAGLAVPQALHALSAAGLADAFIPSRSVGVLSAGERARFAVARAILRAESVFALGHRPTIILDDFADGLDDATARNAAHALRRWLDRAP